MNAIKVKNKSTIKKEWRKHNDSKKNNPEARTFQLLILTLLFFGFFPTFALSQTELGITGEIWGIDETDPKYEIAAAIDQNSQKIVEAWQRIRDLKNYKPSSTVELPPARTSRSYYVVPIYRLPQDITDAYGEVIYPAGFEYNVLEYLPTPMAKTYVFFDGANLEETNWVASRFRDTESVMFVTTGGMESLLAAGRQIPGAIKLLTPDIRDVFRLEHTISLVTQEGNRFLVEVVSPEAHPSNLRGSNQATP